MLLHAYLLSLLLYNLLNNNYNLEKKFKKNHKCLLCNKEREEKEKMMASRKREIKKENSLLV